MQKRPVSWSGKPGGILWLLKWLVVVALVVLVLLAVISSETVVAHPMGSNGDAARVSQSG